MLFVPPCINKFYILDLQPENSLIRYTVEQGHRIFVVSWRNPDASLADKTWDDYIEHGAIRAIRVVQAITGAKTINTLGFCVGGTILATALAVLAARGEQPAQSVTLLTTLLDFSDTGMLDVFVDEASVQLREMTHRRRRRRSGPAPAQGPGTGHHLQLPAPERPGLELRRRQLPQGRGAAAVRPAVLERRRHQPARARCTAGTCATPTWRTSCKEPGTLTVCGEKVDLAQHRGAGLHLRLARRPHRALEGGLRVDARSSSGKKRFVLGASGHIAGVINPPAKGKRSHWTNDTAAGQRRRLVRRRHRDARAAGGPTGAAGSSRWPASWWPRPRRRAAAGTRPSSRRRAATSRPRPERASAHRTQRRLHGRTRLTRPRLRATLRITQPPRR